MVHGPCGGVGPDGACEVAPEPCAFLGSPTVAWRGPPAPAGAPGGTPGGTAVDAVDAGLLAVMARRPVVVAAVPARALDAASLTACAQALRGSVDAVLTGDAPTERVQFPPSYRAALLAAQGLVAWPGLTCRDRNRVALEGELAALAHLAADGATTGGVGGVHCVTGDHTASGHRPDAAPVFDLDSTSLVALARAAGLVVSVAESPAAPPTQRRGERLAQKVRAGAQLCFTQYCGDAEDLARFTADARAAGADVPVVPGVPLVLDRASAAALAGLPAAVLPAGYAQRVLAAADPHQRGVEVALDHARALLTVPGVGGVQVAGAPPLGQELRYAEALAVIGRELGAGC